MEDDRKESWDILNGVFKGFVSEQEFHAPLSKACSSAQ